MSDSSRQFHYVIIGAGSAGCVLANRLSADPSISVLLIEAGGRDWNPWIHIPVGYFKTMHDPKLDWCYRTEPDPGLNDRSIDWPRGKVLGGSSAINGLLYVRGQPRDYDRWRQLGNAGWTWEDVLPYFMRAEDQERGADEYHGVGGPLGVSDIRVRRDVCDAFIRGAGECGIPARDDFNRDDNEGAGYFQLTARNGFRCSSAVGYLKPIRRRPNLTVATKAHVERLCFDARRATGVVYRQSGCRIEIAARQEIILSAGAIGSPQLLQLSGVGPGELLQRFGIPVVHALSGVGRNLQDHLQIRSVYKCLRPTLNDEVNNPLKKMLIGLEYILFRTGPMSMGASQVAAFSRTDPTCETPDIQFPLSASQRGQTRGRLASLFRIHLLGVSASSGKQGIHRDPITRRR